MYQRMLASLDEAQAALATARQNKGQPGGLIDKAVAERKAALFLSDYAPLLAGLLQKEGAHGCRH